jgi:hypothetical protein
MSKEDLLLEEGVHLAERRVAMERTVVDEGRNLLV